MKTRFRVTFWALALLLAGSLRAQALWLDTRAGMKVEDVQKLHPEAHEPPEPGELPAGHGKDLLEIDETVVAGHTFRVRFFFNDENQLVHVDLFETGEILLKEFNRLRDLVREKYGMEYSTTNSASIRLDWHVARTIIQLQWAPLQHGVVTISISYDAPIPKETERL